MQTTDDAIEWVEPPPQKRPHRDGNREFYAALRAKPGAWARYPNAPKNIANAYRIASQIRTGGKAGTRPGEFQAVAHTADDGSCVIDVCFVGAEG